MKEYLDNVADFCSLYSLFIFAMIFHYCLLIENLLSIREEGQADFSLDERVATQARRWLLVLAIFLAVAAPIAAAAYYFGDGHTYMHYLQKYMDEVRCSPPPAPHQTLTALPSTRTPCPPALPLQVADVITILLAALCAAVCASARFIPSLFLPPSPASRKTRQMFTVTFLKVFGSLVLGAYLASALAAHFFTPPIIKWELGFLGSTKEYAPLPFQP